MHWNVPLILLSLAALSLTAFSQNYPLSFATKNKALLSGEPTDFYMHTSNGRWQGGTYGYSRTVLETSDGTIGTKFHEGIDIKPVGRDSAGKPTDRVFPIAPGIVLYANPVSNRSNYGCYVVIKHNTPIGPLYSLYAHLNEVTCQAGQQIRPGQSLGLLGYTGRGIDRKRAHLHLELNMMMSENFDAWHLHHMKAANIHGNGNGINLIGMDVATLLKQGGGNLKSYIKSLKARFVITVPRRTARLEIMQRYPWLEAADCSRQSASWEIDIASSGIPLAIRPSNRRVEEPKVTAIAITKSRHEYYTRRWITGSAQKASLTSSGKRFISLLTGDFPIIQEKLPPQP